MVSHLTDEETGSEKENDLPKVVWLDVIEVGFERNRGGLWLMKLHPSVYHTNSSISDYIVVQLFFWTEI